MSTTTLLPADQWAQKEFAFAKLGDARRNKRLVKIAASLADKPGGTMPQAFPEWDELKAVYRFLDSPTVDFMSVLRPHVERTRKACREPGLYLMIEDTTDLDYSRHRRTSDLGRIGNGNGRGFELHSCLAVRVESWTLDQRPEGQLIGLFGQQCRRPQPLPEAENRKQRLKRRRKSSWWAEAFLHAGRPPQGSQWIYVADRESDFYEPISTCQRMNGDFVIRAYQDRSLADQAGTMRQALAGAVVLGHGTVDLRSRAGEPARTAVVEFRSACVDLNGPWRPGGYQEPLRGVTVVEVREIDAPQGIREPLQWVLLTSLPCRTLAEARRIVGYYAARWWIEEYHKALKTGAGVEDSQLERACRLEALIAILAVVAVRLLNTKMLARSRPEGMEAAQSFGPQMLKILEKKVGKPKSGTWTNQNVVVAVARLGGFLGRKGDGMPGWQTIWRGWQRLIWMCEGLEILKGDQTRCG